VPYNLSMQIRGRVFLAVLLVLLLASACGGGRSAVTLAPGPAAQFELNVLQQSNIGHSGSASLRQWQDGGDTVVEVSVGEAKDLKAFYFELGYDPNSFTPLAAEATGLISTVATGDAALLQVADLGGGKVAHGQVLANWDERAGFTGSGAVTRLRFSPQPHSACRRASVPPADDQDRPVLHIDESVSRLTWDYSCPGDYDQNGLVTVADLTPLGRHFYAQAPFAVGSIESVVDGDGNGLITVGDITPIGRNYEKGISTYEVYFTAHAEKRPEAGAAAVPSLVSIPLASAAGEPGQQQLSFDVHQPLPAPNGWIWIRAAHGGTTGPASLSLQVGEGEDPGNSEPLAQIEVDTADGLSPMTVAFDGSFSTDSDGLITNYEWDWDSADELWDWQDGGTVALAEHTYRTPGTYTATLRVTDNEGAMASAQVGINVAKGPNQDPVAVISVDMAETHTGHYVRFTATESYDWDGEVVEYAWDLDGDGNFYNFTSADITLHDYSKAGIYQAAVRVKDDEGATGEASIEVTVTENQPPVAVLSHGSLNGIAPFSVTFDPAGTYDPEDELYEVYWNLAGNKDYRRLYNETVTVDYLLEPHIATFYLTGEYQCSFYARDEHWAKSNQVDKTVQVAGWLSSCWELANSPLGGDHFDMMVFDGRMAIAMTGYVDSEKCLFFYMAPNNPADEWLEPVLIDDDLGNFGGYCAIALVNGLPSVSYFNNTDDRVYYCSARDSEGREWNDPVEIDSGIGNFGGGTALAEIAGNPAVAWGKGDSARYRRALAPDGLDWSDTAILDSGEILGSPLSMLEFNGTAALCYTDHFWNVRFIHLADETGSVPCEVVELGSPGNGTCMDINLCEINGLPAIMFVGCYSRALDSTCASWSTWQSTHHGGNSDTDFGGQLVTFKDTLVALNQSRESLHLSHSLDENGTQWLGSQIIDSNTHEIHRCLGAAVINDRLYAVFYEGYQYNEPEYLVCRVIHE